jgi:hypothetical protein
MGPTCWGSSASVCCMETPRSKSMGLLLLLLYTRFCKDLVTTENKRILIILFISGVFKKYHSQTQFSFFQKHPPPSSLNLPPRNSNVEHTCARAPTHTDRHTYTETHRDTETVTKRCASSQPPWKEIRNDKRWILQQSICPTVAIPKMRSHDYNSSWHTHSILHNLVPNCMYKHFVRMLFQLVLQIASHRKC